MHTKIYELRFNFDKVGSYEMFFSYPPSEYSVRNAVTSKLRDEPELCDSIVDALSKVDVEELRDGESRTVRYCGHDVGQISLTHHACWQ